MYGIWKRFKPRLNGPVSFLIFPAVSAQTLRTDCSSAQLHRRDLDSRRWRLFFSNLPLCWSFPSYLPYSFLPGCRRQTQAVFSCISAVRKDWESDGDSSNRGCLSEHPEATFPTERVTRISTVFDFPAGCGSRIFQPFVLLCRLTQCSDERDPSASCVIWQHLQHTWLAWPTVSKWDRSHIVSWKHWTHGGAAITPPSARATYRDMVANQIFLRAASTIHKSVSIKLFLSTNLSSVQRCKHSAVAEASVQRGASCFLTTVVEMNHTTIQRLQGEQKHAEFFICCVFAGDAVSHANTQPRW